MMENKMFKPNHFTLNPNIAVVEKILKDGRKYKIRGNRDRYFFPDEWMAFYDSLTKNQKLTFNFLINTGARINEIRNVKLGDVDFERNSIVLRITKSRNKDRSFKVRVIPISSQFAKYLHKEAKEKKLGYEMTFGVLSTPAANLAMEKKLHAVGIPDWQMFSVHNVRKTLETWLLILNVDSLKIIKHFGHSLNMAARHYVSSEAFSFEDKKMIRFIIGDLYESSRFL